MLYIEQDTRRYQELLQVDHGAIPVFDQAHPVPEEAGNYIITGEKTPDYGGGPSPWGFLCNNDGHVIGRVLLASIRR